MNILVLVLRLVHILAGVFWVGGSLITTLFIVPATAATGASGQKFLAHLVTNARVAQRFAAAAGLTVLAGAALYWIDSGGLASGWTGSAAGRGFGIGALLAIAGFAIGIRVGILTREIGSLAAAKPGRETQGQVLELEATQKQLYRLRLVQDSLLVLALAFMATARYWGA